MVALVEAGRTAQHFPPEGFHNSYPLCAFLLAVLFLFVYWRYRFESLGVFLFPMVFVMTSIAFCKRRRHIGRTARAGTRGW